LRDLTYRWRILSLQSLENIQLSLNEHQNIAKALRQKDSVLAGKLMGDHIRAARDRISEALDLNEKTE
jgi:DNA-binding GntR family transcriptional regulator